MGNLSKFYKRFSRRGVPKNVFTQPNGGVFLDVSNTSKEDANTNMKLLEEQFDDEENEDMFTEDNEDKKQWHQSQLDKNERIKGKKNIKQWVETEEDEDQWVEGEDGHQWVEGEDGHQWVEGEEDEYQLVEGEEDVQQFVEGEENDQWAEGEKDDQQWADGNEDRQQWVEGEGDEDKWVESEDGHQWVEGEDGHQWVEGEEDEYQLVEGEEDVQQFVEGEENDQWAEGEKDGQQRAEGNEDGQQWVEGEDGEEQWIEGEEDENKWVEGEEDGEQWVESEDGQQWFEGEEDNDIWVEEEEDGQQWVEGEEEKNKWVEGEEDEDKWVEGEEEKYQCVEGEEDGEQWVEGEEEKDQWDEGEEGEEDGEQWVEGEEEEDQWVEGEEEVQQWVEGEENDQWVEGEKGRQQWGGGKEDEEQWVEVKEVEQLCFEKEEDEDQLVQGDGNKQQWLENKKNGQKKAEAEKEENQCAASKDVKRWAKSKEKQDQKQVENEDKEIKQSKKQLVENIQSKHHRLGGRKNVPYHVRISSPGMARPHTKTENKSSNLMKAQSKCRGSVTIKDNSIFKEVKDRITTTPVFLNSPNNDIMKQSDLYFKIMKLNKNNAVVGGCAEFLCKRDTTRIGDTPPRDGSKTEVLPDGRTFVFKFMSLQNSIRRDEVLNMYKQTHKQTQTCQKKRANKSTEYDPIKKTNCSTQTRDFERSLELVKNFVSHQTTQTANATSRLLYEDECKLLFNVLGQNSKCVAMTVAQVWCLNEEEWINGYTGVICLVEDYKYGNSYFLKIVDSQNCAIRVESTIDHNFRYVVVHEAFHTFMHKEHQYGLLLVDREEREHLQQCIQEKIEMKKRIERTKKAKQMLQRTKQAVTFVTKLKNKLRRKAVERTSSQQSLKTFLPFISSEELLTYFDETMLFQKETQQLPTAQKRNLPNPSLITEELHENSTLASIENKEIESLSHLPPPAESLLRSEEDLEVNTSIPPKPSLSTLRDVGTKHQDSILKKSKFSYKNMDDSFADIPYPTKSLLQRGQYSKENNNFTALSSFYELNDTENTRQDWISTETLCSYMDDSLENLPHPTVSLLQREQDSKEDSNFPALPLFCELSNTENMQQDGTSSETLCSYIDDSSEDLPPPIKSLLQSGCEAKENSDFPPLPSFCSAKDTFKTNTCQNYTSHKATFSHRNANQLKDDEIIRKSNLMTKELGNIFNCEKQRDCSQTKKILRDRVRTYLLHADIKDLLQKAQTRKIMENEEVYNLLKRQRNHQQ